MRLLVSPILKIQNFLWVCWFLCKILSNFVSLPWKLHNPYCHTGHGTYKNAKSKQKMLILLINPLFLLLRSFQKFAKILFHFKPNIDKCELINSNWHGIRTGYFIFSGQTQCKKQKWVEMLYPKDYIQDCLTTLSSA